MSRIRETDICSDEEEEVHRGRERVRRREGNGSEK